MLLLSKSNSTSFFFCSSPIFCIVIMLIGVERRWIKTAASDFLTLLEILLDFGFGKLFIHFLWDVLADYKISTGKKTVLIVLVFYFIVMLGVCAFFAWFVLSNITL